LLPALGTRGSMLAIAAVFLAAGALLAFAGSGTGLRSLLKPKRASAFLLAVASAGVVAFLPPQTIINFNLQRSTTPDVLFHGEGITHTVDIIKSGNGHTIMMINGNIEADTTLLQRRHFILKGHLPLLMHPDPRDVAVVGLGLGITLGATAHHPTVETIRLVELSPDMVKAHASIRDVTGGVLDNPKIKLRIDDGRNFMAMTDERFDMITADPVHPRITGVGYLYTREYYQQIKRRLRPSGVVNQWMPMYRISRESFDVAFRTFVEVFPNASFWYVRGHGLFVATIDGDAIDYATLAARFADPAVARDFASIGIETSEEFLGHLLMDAEHIAKYLARNDDTRVNTDDNAYLEYRTPFEFIEPTKSIVAELLPFAGWDVARRLKNAPGSVKAEVLRQFQHRLRRIQPELSEPID
jgi:spermidine synthase